jgi:hypothetical protein
MARGSLLPLGANEMSAEESPKSAKWIALANSALTGWNVGIISAFLAAILFAIVLNAAVGRIDNPWEIAATICLSVAAGIFCGYKIARLAMSWFYRRKPSVGYVWFVTLLIITVLIFPAPFRYSM